MGGKPRAIESSEVVIWHNPRCSKSRQTLELLRARGIEPTVREYLSDPPGAAELERVLARLALEPRQLMRKKEEPYRALGLGEAGRSRAELVKAMVEHPILIERPVVLRGERAALGRPPESVLALFE